MIEPLDQITDYFSTSNHENNELYKKTKEIVDKTNEIAEIVNSLLPEVVNKNGKVVNQVVNLLPESEEKQGCRCICHEGRSPYHTSENCSCHSEPKDKKELEDHDRLVRELDVLMNGEEGAAKQASLCDIVAQFPRWKVESEQQIRREVIDELYEFGNAPDGWYDPRLVAQNIINIYLKQHNRKTNLGE